MVESVARESTEVIMTVYDNYRHKTTVKPKPEKASIMNPKKDKFGTMLFTALLIDLQRKGVKPGTKLRVIVETVR